MCLAAHQITEVTNFIWSIDWLGSTFGGLWPLTNYILHFIWFVFCKAKVAGLMNLITAVYLKEVEMPGFWDFVSLLVQNVSLVLSSKIKAAVEIITVITAPLIVTSVVPFLNRFSPTWLEVNLRDDVSPPQVQGMCSGGMPFQWCSSYLRTILHHYPILIS